MKIVTIIFLCGSAALGMEQTKPVNAISRATFQDLPTEVQRHILSFVVAGNSKTPARQFYNAAVINKKFHVLINDRTFIFAALNAIPDINGIGLVEQLQCKRFALPVMGTSEVLIWYIYACANRNRELAFEARLGDMMRNRVKREAIKMFTDSLIKHQ